MLFRQLPLAFCLFLVALPSYSQSVIRDGKEWLQPIDFVNLSWEQVEDVCDPTTGACDGFLNAIDVTGYTWASADDVNSLFNSYPGAPPLGPGPDISFTPGSSWGPAILVDFNPTSSIPPVIFTSGITRGCRDSVTCYMASVIDDADPLLYDYVRTDEPAPKTNVNEANGVWLYVQTPATAVPTLPLYGLWFTVLGLAAIAAHRVSRQSRAGLMTV